MATRTALTRAAIVGAAAQILAEFGLADLSMRRVADSLGVQAGALYYHVPNKQSMLSAIADELLGSLPEPASLTQWARDYRRVLLSVRDGAELVTSTRAMGLGDVDPTAPARHLVDAAHADTVLATFEHFVLGATMHDQTQAQLREIGVIAEFDAQAADDTFSRGLEILRHGVGIYIESVA